MKDFFTRNKNLLLMFLILELCLLPAEILLFYKNREFVDIGLLLTAIFLIAFVIPMYNLLLKHNESKKENKEEA